MRSQMAVVWWVAVCAWLVGGGCATTPGGVEAVITPARIEAVTALGAYYGGRAAIAKGHRAPLADAVEALTVIQASDRVDLLAVAAALQAAGIDRVGSDEGSLALGATMVFADLWAGTAQPILDDPRARAVVNGLVRGFSLSLSQHDRRTLDAGKAETDLRQRAEATRG